MNFQNLDSCEVIIFLNLLSLTFLSTKKESTSDNSNSNKETEVNIEEKPNPTEQPEDDLPF